MKRTFPIFLAVLLAAGAGLSGCEDTAPEEQPEEEYAGYSGSGSDGGGGGGGQVKIAGGEDGKTTIADHYESALNLIKKRDWDGAREQLLEALRRSQGKDLQNDIRKHLKIVEQGILAQPTRSAIEVFQAGKNLYEKTVSIRGIFIEGGPVGKTTYYFWVQSGKKIQCRYSRLPLDDKRDILLLKDGAQVLVRGIVKSPWGSNPNPYMELTYFRVEKLAPQPTPKKETGKKE